MIQEEESSIEDILKREVPWKGILKGFIAFLSMGTTYIIITYFPDWFLIAILLIILSVILMIPQLPGEESKRQTLSVLKCENIECTNQKVKDYEDGDFVFKKGGFCPKCNYNFKIIEIYSIKIKENRKQEKLKKKKENITII